MKKHTTRQAILDAAIKVAKRDGITQLTIDTVAQEAGLSKGGVFYHFPSKEALIEGMTSWFLADFEQDLATTLAQEEPDAGKWIRSYIRASSNASNIEPDVITAMLVAFAVHPHLLEPLREHYRMWQQEAEHDGLDPALATILRLAVDGLLFADLLHLAPPTGTFRTEVIDKMLALAQTKEHKK